ncbi:MAG: helix-turn-helix domain-containing protein [Clostridium sp.]
MNKRIMLLRKELNLTLEKFGQRIGVTRAAISNIETGNRKVTEQMFKSICREFNVREDWLRNGNGEMFKIFQKMKKLLQYSEIYLQIKTVKYMILKWRFFES